MDACVAQSAILILLISQGVCRRRELDAVTVAPKIPGPIVTLQARCENLRSFEESCIHAAMWSVTGTASINFYRGMFKDKGPTLVNMAL